jgi:hypothetical protein
MQNHSKIIIKVAAIPTRCFVCEARIQQGEAYMEIEDERVCVKCGLPARRLRPLNKANNNTLINTY